MLHDLLYNIIQKGNPCLLGCLDAGLKMGVVCVKNGVGSKSDCVMFLPWEALFTV